MQPATQRFLIITAVILMTLFVIGNIVLTYVNPTTSYTLNTANQPYVGNPQSKVEVVVFQDPMCAECKNFNNVVFPKIKKDYIDTNRIKYTVIPIASADGTTTAAEGLLCIYYQDENTPNSKLFFTVLDYFYAHLPTQISDVSFLALAEKADPSLNMDKVKRCMDKNVYYTRIRQNTAESSRVSGNNNTKPAVFVNGLRIDSSSPDNLIKAIDNIK